MQVHTAHSIGEEAKHWDYNIEKSERTITINEINGEYLGGILDNEDGITVIIAGQEIVLGYHEAEQLLALLLAHYDGNLKLVDTKTVRSI